MKPHYFNQEIPDQDDAWLKLAKQQGYVPEGCLLNGELIRGLVNQNKDPCKGCNGPREKCGGRKKGEEEP